MQTTIKNLYYGNISPTEQLHVNDEGYQTMSLHACDLEKNFLKTLAEKQEQDFQAVMDARMTASSLEVMQSFVDGFKLGIKLMAETLCDE